MMMMLCTDSFTEAICMKPKLMIRNILSNEDVMRMVSNYLHKFSFDLTATANALCEDQIEKFNFPRQGYAGDNTTIVLIDFDAHVSGQEPVLEAGAQVCAQGVEGSGRLFVRAPQLNEEGNILSGIKRPSVCLKTEENHDQVLNVDLCRPRSVSRESYLTSSPSTPSSNSLSTSKPNSTNNSFTTTCGSSSPEVKFLIPVACHTCKKTFPNSLLLAQHVAMYEGTCEGGISTSLGSESSLCENMKTCTELLSIESEPNRFTKTAAGASAKC